MKYLDKVDNHHLRRYDELEVFLTYNIRLIVVMTMITCISIVVISILRLLRFATNDLNNRVSSNFKILMFNSTDKRRLA